MNHCPIEAADRRHATEQGIRDSKEIIIESHTNGIIDQFKEDLQSISDHPLSHYQTMTVAKSTIALLAMLKDSDALYALAEKIAVQAMESSHDL